MTRLSYLDNTYLFDMTSRIEGVSRDDRGAYVMLDQTVFYPQGGGQPADKGTIEVNGTTVQVDFVGFAEGHVRHYVSDDDARMMTSGQEVVLKVDETHRLANARTHTGGHFVGHVFETLDQSLVPIKGYHFADGSYVEFLNEAGVDGATLLDRANERLAHDVTLNLPVTAAYSDFETIQALRPYLAPNIPREKPSRIVTIGGYRSLPCGGTHVSSLAELGSIRITKVKSQKGNLKVSYQIG
jgi:Ser-tRNA(Ala) deacylase AlaX